MDDRKRIKLKKQFGDIRDVSQKAIEIALAIDDDVDVEFEFNGHIFTADKNTQPNQLFKEWSDADSNQENIFHLEECSGCKRCERLLEGQYMFCEDCGCAGRQDSGKWVAFGKVLVCPPCASSR